MGGVVGDGVIDGVPVLDAVCDAVLLDDGVRLGVPVLLLVIDDVLVDEAVSEGVGVVVTLGDGVGHAAVVDSLSSALRRTMM